MECKMIKYNSVSIRRYLSLMQRERNLERGNFIERNILAQVYRLVHKFECEKLCMIIEKEVKELC